MTWRALFRIAAPAPSATVRPALTATTGALFAPPAMTMVLRFKLAVAPPVDCASLIRLTVLPIRTSSTCHPVLETLVSEAIRKRIWTDCPARELRSARVWI